MKITKIVGATALAAFLLAAGGAPAMADEYGDSGSAETIVESPMGPPPGATPGGYASEAGYTGHEPVMAGHPGGGGYSQPPAPEPTDPAEDSGYTAEPVEDAGSGSGDPS